jgi:hypothetical protein
MYKKKITRGRRGERGLIKNESDLLSGGEKSYIGVYHDKTGQQRRENMRRVKTG